MIKDILVTLPTGDAPSLALDYAVSVARSFDAHLTGITFVQDPASAGSLFDSARVMDGCRREVEDAAAAAKVRFEETWRREGLSAESMVLNEGAFSLPELFARTARRFDLTILPQPDPENGRSAEIMLDAALLGSGRPILIVPYFWEAGVKFGRILVCWDGSLNAARAIADGMPFLTRAKQVEVVTVATDGNGDDGNRAGHWTSSFPTWCERRSQKDCRSRSGRVIQDLLSCCDAISRFNRNGWLWSFAAS